MGPSSVFTFDLGDMPMEKKEGLIRDILEMGGHLSYLLTPKTTHLLTTDIYSSMCRSVHSGCTVLTIGDFHAALARRAHEGRGKVMEEVAKEQQQVRLVKKDDSRPQQKTYPDQDKKGPPPVQSSSDSGSDVDEEENDDDDDDDSDSGDDDDDNEDVERKYVKGRPRMQDRLPKKAAAFGSKASERFDFPKSTPARPPHGSPLKTVAMLAQAPGSFSEKDYSIVTFVILQCTNLGGNNNKFYGIEVHDDTFGHYRVYSHWGRTDDLIKNPNAGQTMSRFCPSLEAAMTQFNNLKASKMSGGYQEVKTRSNKIGSAKLRASGGGGGGAPSSTSSSATPQSPSGSGADNTTSKLPQALQDMVRYIYEEAKSALLSRVAVTITATGIETPLGVLGLEQVEAGEATLERIRALVMKSEETGQDVEREVTALTSTFYSLIPHNLTSSRGSEGRAVMAASALNTLDKIKEKDDLCQLMKDMLNINRESNVLFSESVDRQYESLHVMLEVVPPTSTEFALLSSTIVGSQAKPTNIDVVNIFKVYRPAERAAYQTNAKSRTNASKALYHGSRISNWVGLLSRGMLMPKAVVAGGGKRTDAGMLGAGLYFGSAASTAAQYSTPGAKGTRFMAVNDVALGRVCDFTTKDPTLTAPPHGYDSTHGLPLSKSNPRSDFVDEEYVVYEARQQAMAYVVEFTAQVDSEALLKAAADSGTFLSEARSDVSPLTSSSSSSLPYSLTPSAAVALTPSFSSSSGPVTSSLGTTAPPAALNAPGLRGPALITTASSVMTPPRSANTGGSPSAAAGASGPAPLRLWAVPSPQTQPAPAPSSVFSSSLSSSSSSSAAAAGGGGGGGVGAFNTSYPSTTYVDLKGSSSSFHVGGGTGASTDLQSLSSVVSAPPPSLVSPRLVTGGGFGGQTFSQQVSYHGGSSAAVPTSLAPPASSPYYSLSGPPSSNNVSAPSSSPSDSYNVSAPTLVASNRPLHLGGESGSGYVSATSFVSSAQRGSEASDAPTLGALHGYVERDLGNTLPTAQTGPLLCLSMPMTAGRRTVGSLLPLISLLRRNAVVSEAEASAIKDVLLSQNPQWMPALEAALGEFAVTKSLSHLVHSLQLVARSAGSLRV